MCCRSAHLTESECAGRWSDESGLNLSDGSPLPWRATYGCSFRTNAVLVDDGIATGINRARAACQVA